MGRFVNIDNQLSCNDFTGMNLFAYCGNNPVSRTDSSGEDWYHWAIGAAVVAACAVATVVTCGMSVAAAATAVSLVSYGIAASTTASTIAAAAFIGSATLYGTAVLVAASSSSSIQEFNDQGDWGTVGTALGGALLGGFYGQELSKEQAYSGLPNTENQGNSLGIPYPGNNPNNCEVPGSEWRGSGPPSSGHGNYVNMETGEWLHPDLNHGLPIGPHWDYGIRGNPQTFRIFPDGTILPK